MKKFLLYAMAILGDILLYKLSEQSEGTDWLYALLIAGLFAWSVQGWKRYRTNGFGLFFLTAFGLFMMNSVLYLLSPPITIVLFSLLFGFILIPIYVNYHDEVLTSWWLVLLNILVNLEVPNEVIFWFTLLTSGIGP